MIEIVPLPPKGKRGRKPTGMRERLDGLAQSTVGASLFFVLPITQCPDQRVLSARLAAMACGIGGNGWYATRYEGEGVRIWKVAEPLKHVAAEGAGAVVAPARAVG